MCLSHWSPSRPEWDVLLRGEACIYGIFLVAALCHSAVKSYGIWNRTWPMGGSLHTVYGGFGCGLFCRARQRLCCSFWAAGCRVHFKFSTGVPEREQLWKPASGVRNRRSYGTWLGAALIPVLHSEEDNFPALWRRRRTPRMKKTSLEVQAKCSTAGGL